MLPQQVNGSICCQEGDVATEGKTGQKIDKTNHLKKRTAKFLQTPPRTRCQLYGQIAFGELPDVKRCVCKRGRAPVFAVVVVVSGE